MNETLVNCSDSNSTANEFGSAFVVLGTLYSLVFLLAIVGNSAVIYVVARNTRMQTVTNVLIANLAASDILCSLSSSWVTPTYAYKGSWTFGRSMCYVCPLLQGASIFISTLTLTAIALDRYFAIVHPMKARLNCCLTFLLLASVWIVSFVLVTPYAVSMTYELDGCVTLCYETWEREELRHIYGVIVTVMQYGLPFLVITFCYASICRKLWYKPRKPSITVGYRTAKKRRMVRMLIWMVVIFAICWAPINIGNIIRDNYPALVDSRHFPLIFLSTHLLAVSGTCWNPFLYGFMNKNFQREFLIILPFASTSGLELSLSTNLLRKSSEMSNRRSTSRKSKRSSNGDDDYNYQSGGKVDSGIPL